jgi:hypothetical protein
MDKLLETILNKMFELSENQVSIDEILQRKDDWYNEFKMTEIQHQQWLEWGKSYLKKKVARPEVTMALIDASWGLKIIS